MRYVFLVGMAMFFTSTQIQAVSGTLMFHEERELAIRDSIWFAENPGRIPHFKTLDEIKTEQEVGYSVEIPENAIMAAPQAPVRNIAEFEPMEGVVIVYPLGIPVSLVKEMSEDVKVYCITRNESSASSSFKNAGVNMDNVQFINRGSDGYWTRDYGPWWVFDGNGKAGIVDFKYNRPKPQDNGFNGSFGKLINSSVYYMSLEHAGGNYMCDGYGVAASTYLVKTENNLSASGVLSRAKEYLGIEKYFLTSDPPNEYIKHIDCWGKFLAPNKIMIGKVSGSKKQRYDAIADSLGNEISSWGTPYKVYRVSLDGSPYTNCTIINNKVLLPGRGGSSDQAAIQAFQDAMPGYEILSFAPKSGEPWKSTDALHCRTKGVADREMLDIRHVPLHDTLKSVGGSGYLVEASIIPHSEKAVIDDSLLVYYRYGESGDFSTVNLSVVSGDKYKASIPSPKSNSIVSYYIHVADKSERSENHPYIGAKDAHVFYGKTDGTVNSKQDNIAKTSGLISMQKIGKNIVLTIDSNNKSDYGNINVHIYRNDGQLVRELVLNGDGNTPLVWNYTNESNRRVANGVYFCVINTKRASFRGKINIVD